MKLFLKNKNICFAKNHCEIQVRTILVCPLYSIKYGIQQAYEQNKATGDIFVLSPWPIVTRMFFNQTKIKN